MELVVVMVVEESKWQGESEAGYLTKPADEENKGRFRRPQRSASSGGRDRASSHCPNCGAHRPGAGSILSGVPCITFFLYLDL